MDTGIKIEVSKPKTIPRFREYLTRWLRGERVKWESKGENIAPWDGKNRQKRAEREGRRIDRLAHIAYERRNGNEKHVPKLKRVPRSVFE